MTNHDPTPLGHPAKPPAAHLDMVEDTRRFVTQLRGRGDPGLDLRQIEIADEFHATVPGVVLTRPSGSSTPERVGAPRGGAVG